MRKTLLISLVFAASAASLALLARPIRSTLGSEGSAYSEGGDGPTVLDYVQDGLVAMWDGKVLPGQNLVADYGDLPLREGEASGGAINLSRGVMASFPYNFCWTYDVGSIFVTCRVSNPSHTSHRVFMFPHWYGTSSSVGVYSFNASIPIRMFRGVNWQNAVNSASWPEDDELTASYGIVFSTKKGTDNPDNVFVAYLDDTKVYEVRGSSWYFNYDFGMTDDTSWLVSGDSGCDMSFYNIRLYNRELTPAEIEWNYQIDRERFGL